MTSPSFDLVLACSQLFNVLPACIDVCPETGTLSPGLDGPHTRFLASVTPCAQVKDSFTQSNLLAAGFESLLCNVELVAALATFQGTASVLFIRKASAALLEGAALMEVHIYADTPGTRRQATEAVLRTAIPETVFKAN